MSVRVAKSAGFCFGVNRAVELVEQAVPEVTAVSEELLLHMMLRSTMVPLLHRVAEKTELEELEEPEEPVEPVA